MFRLPFGERVDPMEEKRQARENTINSVVTFCIICAAIRVGECINVVVFKDNAFVEFNFEKTNQEI